MAIYSADATYLKSRFESFSKVTTAALIGYSNIIIEAIETHLPPDQKKPFE